jgi:hypothetical protein
MACLPHVIEEKLNLLLDGGFHPTQQIFVKILVKKMFQLRCDDIIEKLKITVNKSASVYMVPDFDRVLEPDEVYIDISSFREESAGLSAADLFGGGDLGYEVACSSFERYAKSESSAQGRTHAPEGCNRVEQQGCSSLSHVEKALGHGFFVFESYSVWGLVNSICSQMNVFVRWRASLHNR